MSEVYSRPDEPESVAFWACLRRAFPDAETDSEQWERALANGAVMCDVLGAMTLRSWSRSPMELVMLLCVLCHKHSCCVLRLLPAVARISRAPCVPARAAFMRCDVM
jgi:hypothetical protein